MECKIKAQRYRGNLIKHINKIMHTVKKEENAKWQQVREDLTQSKLLRYISIIEQGINTNQIEARISTNAKFTLLHTEMATSNYKTCAECLQPMIFIHWRREYFIRWQFTVLNKNLYFSSSRSNNFRFRKF